MHPFAMNPVTFELTVGLDGNARSGQGVLAAYVPASDFGVPVCLLSNDPRHEPETGIEEITPPLLAHIRDSIDDSEPLWCWCIIDSRGCFREALPKWQPHGFPTVSFQSFAGGFNIDAFLGVTGPAGEAAMELLSKMLDIPATDSDSPSEREFLEKVEVHGNLPAPGNIFRKVDAAVAKGDVRLVAAAIQPDPVLSLSLINSANAARFANAGRTASVPESVMRLGTSFVRRIVFVAEMMGRYQSGACSNLRLSEVLAQFARQCCGNARLDARLWHSGSICRRRLHHRTSWRHRLAGRGRNLPLVDEGLCRRCKDADPITKARAQRELFPLPSPQGVGALSGALCLPALVLQAVAGDVSGGRAWYDCLAQAVRVAQALEPFECIATPTNIPVPDACRTEWESWHQALSVIS
jgi:hypothetical protein